MQTQTQTETLTDIYYDNMRENYINAVEPYLHRNIPNPPLLFLQ